MAGDEAYFVAEGETPPAGLPPEVRLIGPGAPGASAPDEPEVVAEGVPGPPPEDLTPPESSGASSDPGDDEDGPVDWAAYRIVDLRDLARERGLSPTGAKADLVALLTEYDAEHAS